MTSRLCGAVVIIAACGASSAPPGTAPPDVDAAIARSEALRLAADWDGADAVIEPVLAAATGRDARLRLLVEQSAIARHRHTYTRFDDLAAAAAILAQADALVAGAGPLARAAHAEERGWHAYSRAFDGAATFADARRSFEEARALLEPRRKPGELAMSWFQIGLTHEQSGELEDARAAYRRGLEYAERARSLVAQGYLQRHLGSVESDLAKDPRIAVPYWEKSLALREESGHRFGVVFAAITLADALARTGDPARASALLEQAAALGRELRVWRGVATAHEALADLARARGATADACAQLAIAARAWADFGDVKSQAASTQRQTDWRCEQP